MALRIGYLNYADLATLTASPVADAAKPVTHLQNDARGYTFAATSAALQTIKGTWGGDAYTISQLCLWRHNLAYGDTIKLTLYPNADWTGTAIYESAALAAYESGLFTGWGWGFTNRYFTPAAAVKSFSIVVSAAAALEFQRLYLGPYTEAPSMPAEGATEGWQGNSEQTRRQGGSLAVAVNAKWRALAFDMMVDTEAHRAAWSEIGRYCMNEESVVASFYQAGGTQERDHTVFGKFEDNPMRKIMQSRWDFSMKINGL